MQDFYRSLKFSLFFMLALAIFIQVWSGSLFTTGECARSAEVLDGLQAKLGKSCHRMTKYDLFKVKRLSLRARSIKELRAGDFRGLTRLAVLDLSNNKLVSLPDEIFDPLPSLAVLILNENQIESFSPRLIKKNTKLVSLHLQKNKLRDLRAGLVGEHRLLYQLRIDQNEIEELSEDTFLGGESLYMINMARNKLKSLPKKVFSSLKSLSILSLESNFLQGLDSHIFSDLKKLKLLVLNDNKLERLPNLSSLSELYRLDVRHNKLLSQPEGLGSSVKVDLDGNPVAEVTRLRVRK